MPAIDENFKMFDRKNSNFCLYLICFLFLIIPKFGLNIMEIGMVLYCRYISLS